MTASPAAVILAAGESTRMGFPKALLSYRGTTFLEHLAAVLAGFSPVRLQPLLVVLGHDAERIRGAVHLPAGVNIIVNEQYRLGQLSSLQTAVRALDGSGAAGLLVAPVDHPCISEKVVDLLLAAFAAESPAVVAPVFEGRRGHPVIFSSRLFSDLLKAPLDQGARAVVRRHPVREVNAADPGILADIDDPEIYKLTFGEPPP